MACCISTWNTCLCISIWALPVLWVPLKHKHGAMNSRRVEKTRPGRMRVKTCLFSKRHTLHRICPKFRSYLLNWLWPLLSSSSFSLCSSSPDRSRFVFFFYIRYAWKKTCSWILCASYLHSWMTWEKSLKLRLATAFCMRHRWEGEKISLLACGFLICSYYCRFTCCFSS